MIETQRLLHSETFEVLSDETDDIFIGFRQLNGSGSGGRRGVGGGQAVPLRSGDRAVVLLLLLLVQLFEARGDRALRRRGIRRLRHHDLVHPGAFRRRPVDRQGVTGIQHRFGRTASAALHAVRCARDLQSALIAPRSPAKTAKQRTFSSDPKHCKRQACV